MDERLIARFWSKVDRRGPDECWNWLACLATSGYGRIGISGRSGGTGYAHHLSWEFANGPRNGLWVLHKCDNRRCVNPAHLFLGTHKDNMRDMVNKGRGPLGRDNTWARGELNNNSKLTADHVREIRRRYTYRSGVGTLAAEFGISIGTLNKVVRRESWAHIE